MSDRDLWPIGQTRRIRCVRAEERGCVVDLQFGDYQILATLGRGSMGEVVLGRAVDGRLVAIKRVHSHLADRPDFRARFRLEVAASRRVTGAYTAGVVDADPDASVPWLASEYVAGPSLETVVETIGPLPVGSVWRLALGLAAALDGIHRAGLVHRDVKPSNVLLAEDGPRVIDFGVARAVDSGDDLTGTGSVVGSPAFMSPEQAQGKLLTPASDMFSFGSVLVAAATGRGPFGGTSVPQTLFNVVHVQPDIAELPEQLQAIVAACLAKQPEKRPTAAAVLDRLAAAPAGDRSWPDDVTALIDEQRKRVRQWLAEADTLVVTAGRSRRKRWLAWAAAVATVFAIGTAALLSTRGAEPTAMPAPAQFDLVAADLRGVDACELVDDLTEFGAALDDPIGYDWGACEAALRHINGDTINSTIELGAQSILTFDKTGRYVAGALLTEGESLRKPGCVVRARSSRDQDAVVQLEIDGPELTDACGTAEDMLTRIVERLATDPPRTELDADSLRSIAPCATVDPDSAAASVGAPTVLVPVSIHTCEWWAGLGHVEMSFEDRARPDRGAATPMTTPGGRTVYESADPSYCAADYLYRPTDGDHAELVSVVVEGVVPGLPGFCERARAVVDVVASNLPGR